MNSYIKSYVKSCHLSQIREKPKLKPNGLLNPIVTHSPFEQIAIDHLGDFVPSKSGKKYIIVVTDNFSKYAICKAVRKSYAKNIAKFLF
jgi:hypothetical protein